MRGLVVELRSAPIISTAFERVEALLLVVLLARDVLVVAMVVVDTFDAVFSVVILFCSNEFVCNDIIS